MLNDAYSKSFSVPPECIPNKALAEPQKRKKPLDDETEVKDDLQESLQHTELVVPMDVLMYLSPSASESVVQLEKRFKLRLQLRERSCCFPVESTTITFDIVDGELSSRKRAFMFVQRLTVRFARVPPRTGLGDSHDVLLAALLRKASKLSKPLDINKCKPSAFAKHLVSRDKLEAVVAADLEDMFFQFVGSRPPSYGSTACRCYAGFYDRERRCLLGIGMCVQKGEMDSVNADETCTPLVICGFVVRNKRIYLVACPLATTHRSDGVILQVRVSYVLLNV